MADQKLALLLEQHKGYFDMQSDGKVVCLANGHAFPPNYETVQAFITGKKFPKLIKRFDATRSLQRFEPCFVVSKNFPEMIYCAVTGQLLEKSVEAIQKHIAGKKYSTIQGRHEGKTPPLKPEPNIEDVLRELKIGKQKERTDASAIEDEEEHMEIEGLLVESDEGEMLGPSSTGHADVELEMDGSQNVNEPQSISGGPRKRGLQRKKLENVQESCGKEASTSAKPQIHSALQDDGSLSDEEEDFEFQDSVHAVEAAETNVNASEKQSMKDNRKKEVHLGENYSKKSIDKKRLNQGLQLKTGSGGKRVKKHP
ncbi:hypothetical protein CEUSTIGMA_g516.t1 [Chlamydomonas eustigma]|uniref:Surfeit locus protein 2 n=1 Tax=Chlamydomonas eustigma TaxID=1157962 RepID=A0A250WQG8_9CHLO|nr:hypothetical protein CEUSTIGMA_g516.t1 [Chlamydomonas eustigma]|eukprot:GAX73063.1 hypothetical protein CEUSTIGMA_g516.t1 [Chlamydomonas eustigma]